MRKLLKTQRECLPFSNIIFWHHNRIGAVMKISKKLLLTTAAALTLSSHAFAADAIVAAEPEALEYVRVCDAFGTGFFYIPGTETCLKIGGLVRFQVDISRDEKEPSDWNAWTRAEVNFDARTETELGALRSYIALRGEPDSASDAGVFVHEAYIELGGLTVGKFLNWWDNDIAGEGDALGTNANFNSIRYQYDSGSFQVGLSVDELEGTGVAFPDNNVGISGNIGATFGAVTANLIGGYDVDHEEGALRFIATADVGPGSLGFAAVWASGWNAYYAESDWAIAASYAASVTDKLTLTGLVQYSDDVEFNNGVDKWTYGLTAEYAVTSGLDLTAAVWVDDQDFSSTEVSGFLRLERSF